MSLNAWPICNNILGSEQSYKFCTNKPIMSDTHFVSLTASDKGGSRGAGRISAVPRDTCKHLSQDGLHIHTPGSQELHGGTYKIKNK